MKKYILEYKYCYNHESEHPIFANSVEEAIKEAKEILKGVGGLDEYHLVEVGNVISLEI
jgi:hypothetical protein